MPALPAPEREMIACLTIPGLELKAALRRTPRGRNALAHNVDARGTDQNASLWAPNRAVVSDAGA